MIDGECSNLQVRLGQLPERPHARSIVTRAPDLSARIVAVNIETIEFREWIPIVNDSARQRAKVGMGMFDGGPNGRGGTQLAIEIKWMTSLIHTPPVVFTALNQMGRFPE